MAMRLVDNWPALVGRTAEIRRSGKSICRGVVDATSASGALLWIVPIADSRRLYEKAAGYEAWSDDAGLGFVYHTSMLQPDGNSQFKVPPSHNKSRHECT